ncbi:MAG: AI-2E family transporter [Saprospiraceae bacterium]|nr:AI-2E family transporter [Saprospiraceae bacterium]
MSANKFSLRQLASFGALLFMGIYILVIGKSILVPLVFGALFAFMLKPLCTRFERWIKWRSMAIMLAMISAIIPVTGIIYFFSSQFMTVVADMSSIKEKMNAGITMVYSGVRNMLGFTRAETDKFFTEQLPSMVSSSSFFGDGVSSSVSFCTGFLLTFIYIFLFLLYRSAFKNFILMQTHQTKRESTHGLLESVQKVIQGYLQGLVMVISIMGILNSVGLCVIGIKHPFFWGFLAAMLAVIPYIGTFIGGLLPFLYAIGTANEAWQPVAVVILFVVVQVLEGNFITPKVVGSSVSINPLAALIALLVGAEIWGIVGMILSLPCIAILNELLKQSDAWRPVSLLISDEIGINEHLFNQKWNKERFRLSNFFKSPR